MIVMVLTCPVTVITDVIGVGIQVVEKVVAGVDGIRATAAVVDVVDAGDVGVIDVEDVVVEDTVVVEEEMAWVV